MHPASPTKAALLGHLFQATYIISSFVANAVVASGRESSKTSFTALWSSLAWCGNLVMRDLASLVGGQSLVRVRAGLARALVCWFRAGSGLIERACCLVMSSLLFVSGPALSQKAGRDSEPIGSFLIPTPFSASLIWSLGRTLLWHRDEGLVS